MVLAAQPGATDLLIPTPGEDQHWSSHRIHTHYFGFSVPEAEIGAFLYIRYQPEFRSSQGGVCIFQGHNNVSYTDIEHIDYQVAMPWPTVDGHTITTANGFRIEFSEPGTAVRLTYTSGDGNAAFDVVQRAITPLVARGHIMPGEELHHEALNQQAGGSEQFMHAVGELTLHGRSHSVDCHAPRDRSWNQVREESYVATPPLGWTPMYFGPDLAVSQISFEPLDTEPFWVGLYDVGDRPSHHFGWVQRSDETRSIVSVHREVQEVNPLNFIPVRQEVTIEDERGERYHFSGEAIASAPLPAWPNALFHDALVRWTDQTGRVTHTTFQGIWMVDYHRMMKRRFRP